MSFAMSLVVSFLYVALSLGLRFIFTKEAMGIYVALMGRARLVVSFVTGVLLWAWGLWYVGIAGTLAVIVISETWCIITTSRLMRDRRMVNEIKDLLAYDAKVKTCKDLARCPSLRKMIGL